MGITLQQFGIDGLGPQEQAALAGLIWKSLYAPRFRPRLPAALFRFGHFRKGPSPSLRRRVASVSGRAGSPPVTLERFGIHHLDPHDRLEIIHLIWATRPDDASFVRADGPG